MDGGTSFSNEITRLDSYIRTKGNFVIQYQHKLSLAFYVQ